MMRVKEVYFKNTVYKVPIDDLKHVNGFDVVKLPNQTFVYYDMLRKKYVVQKNDYDTVFNETKEYKVDKNGNKIFLTNFNNWNIGFI